MNDRSTATDSSTASEASTRWYPTQTRLRPRGTGPLTSTAESVLYGRLFGVITFWLFGSSENSPPRLWRMNP